MNRGTVDWCSLVSLSVSESLRNNNNHLSRRRSRNQQSEEEENQTRQIESYCHDPVCEMSIDLVTRELHNAKVGFDFEL